MRADVSDAMGVVDAPRAGGLGPVPRPYPQDKVNKNMKQAQSRKRAGRGLDTRDDEGASEAAAAPRRWTDYTARPPTRLPASPQPAPL